MTETETARFVNFYPEDGNRARVTYAPDRTPVAYVSDDGRYEVAGYGGVAFYLVGRSQRWEPWSVWIDDDDHGGGGYWETDTGQGEWEDDPDGQLWACMVGDDRLHPVDPEDLTEIADEDYCGGCGQLGCTADGR